MTGYEDRLRTRLATLALVALFMFGVLVTRLWFLQVLAGDRYTDEARRNHVRLVRVEAPRGRILDRNGKVLVENRPSLVVGLRRDDLPPGARDLRTLKVDLADLLGITVRDIDRRLADRRPSPYEPVVIAEDVAPEVVFALAERAADHPGVETFAVPVRTYPLGPLAAHLIGYVGETNEYELDTLRGYRLGDEIGRTGIERVYERWLRGKPGLEKLEVDALGRVLGTLGSRPPTPGADVVLSIDAEAQLAAEEALRQGIERARSQTFRVTGERFRAPAGGLVVLDVRTGGVVAMASYPTFDLRRFVGGVDAGYWQSLNDPANDYPLLNRAVQAAYPPGSTFKPIPATAALATGAATPATHIQCTTGFRFGDRVFRNWRARNASITVAQALVESCDTVFYKLAANWWANEVNDERAGHRVYETLQEWARMFGLGQPTGIDLPQETDGFIPGRATRRAAWERNRDAWCRRAERTGDVIDEDLCERGYVWRGGDAVNMSIGQGEVQVSPLQLAVAYGAVATGGRVLEPHLAARIVSPEGEVVRRIEPEVRWRVKAPDDAFRYVQDALARVPGPGGTAYFPFHYPTVWPLEEIPMAAKTGSAEIAGKQPFSWFASYGPADRPRYVAVSVVEQAGFGSQISGPIVRRIMDELFGLPPTPIVYGPTRSD